MLTSATADTSDANLLLLIRATSDAWTQSCSGAEKVAEKRFLGEDNIKENSMKQSTLLKHI